MNTLRLLIADEQEIFRAGLRLLLQAQPDMEIVASASDAPTAWQQARELLPDVAIVDMALLQSEGMQDKPPLASLCAMTRVLLLATQAETSQVRQALQEGVAGYVLKRIAADELCRAIRTVAVGDIYLDPTMAGHLVAGYLRPPTPLTPVPADLLSPRESEVLRLLAWGHSNKAIAAHLGVSVKTVETYKTRLMHKLHLHNRVDLVRYAVRQGWLQEP